MGSVYARGNKLWIAYAGRDGRRIAVSTSYAVGQEAQARKTLAVIEEKLAAGEQFEADDGRVTVASYFKKRLVSRKATLSTWRNEESRFRLYVAPRVGSMAMDEVRPRHVHDLVKQLRSQGMAPRTLRNTYSILRALFRDAQIEGLVELNPCVLTVHHLGKVVDADPDWRRDAVFTRGEAETILSDEGIPQDRRVFYGFMFLGGLRFGEIAALRWRDLDGAAELLGRIHVTKSIHSVEKREKSTKTGRTREVPVHPVLAMLLAEWKLTGWPLLFRRSPGPDDLVAPSRLGKPRSVSHMLKKFHEDLTRLELRERRQHDARRTFISLARADGARPDILRWVTHGPSGSVMDDYTTLPWETLCGAVACLKIGLLEGRVVPLKAAVGAPEARETRDVDSRSTTVLLQTQRAKNETPATRAGCGGPKWRGVGDSNPWPPA